VTWWDALEDSREILAPLFAFLATALGPVLSAFTIAYVLSIKKNSTSAVAWCLLVLLLPLLGPFLFLLFGYQHVAFPLLRKRRHRRLFQVRHPVQKEQPDAEPDAGPDGCCRSLQRLAQRVGATRLLQGNHVTFYHDGTSAYEAMRDAVRAARHHIHLEYFIFQPDEAGRAFVELLARKVREGVEVRLLYDAMGSHRLRGRFLSELTAAGGRCCLFLPINLLRRRIQVNLRNHRKILVVDGQVAFTGGFNIGDEYLGRSPFFGPWRDTQLRLEGPAVAALQRLFLEDWDFAASEDLGGPDYYPAVRADGPYPVQVVESGPDRELKAIREVYFAAILEARERLWIASPYFVPDAGLLDALCLACYRGVDVRLLTLFQPDKWVPFLAARYYWGDVLQAGGRVYQYTRGMMHSKVVLVDGRWASVGTANLDNRSMYLNFEVNCLIHSAAATAELEAAFLRDLETAIRVERHAFSRRPVASRLLENACRLFSPIL
jgi:cardiolipin synthase